MGDGEGGGREGEGEKGRKDTKIRYRWKFCLHHSLTTRLAKLRC